MNLLALETATQHLSVALWRDGQCQERAVEIANGGSEWLLPAARELLSEAGLEFADLQGIAFGAGPGGFTGLRLACGVAQGLACALDLPVLGVSSLEALALQGWQQQTQYKHVLACLDARMNEVYCAAYEIQDGLPVTRLAAFVAAPSDVAENLQTMLADAALSKAAWLGCGDGFAAYPDLPVMLSGQGADVLDLALTLTLPLALPHCWPTAAAVAQLAAARFAREAPATIAATYDAALAAPLYVRDKVALTTAERLARGGAK